MRLPTVLFTLAAIGMIAACNQSAEPATPPHAEEPAPQAPAADAETTTDSGTADATIPPTPASGVPVADEVPQGKRAAGEENLPMNAWRAFGNEPFWSVRLDGDTLVFSTPGDQAGKTMQGRRVPSLIGIVYMGTDDAGREFNLDIQPGQCSDGMSDNTYQHVATFIYGETTYRGCAEPAK